MKNYILAFAFLLLSTTFAFCQQSPTWSTFYENGFIWNPALTARWNSWEVNSTLRQEWSGFEDAPQYGTLGFQYPFIKNITKVAIGAYIDFDEVGPFKSIGIGGTYVYKIYPRWFGNRDGVLSMGLSAKLNQFRFKANKLRAFEGIEGDFAIPQNGETYINPDFSFGMFYNSVSDFYAFESHYYFGASINRLVPVENTISPFGNWRQVPHANFHGGLRIQGDRHSNTYIEPSMMISYAFANQINVMAHVRYEKNQKYWAAIGGVTNGEVFGQVGVIFNDRSVLGWLVKDGILRLGTKVDYSIGSLGQFAGMGYEAFIGYTFSEED